MTERIFKSYEEYKNAFFPNENQRVVANNTNVAAGQLAIRAIEMNVLKLKTIKCAEQKNSQGRS